MRKLIANRAFTYGTEPVRAGAAFMATNLDALALLAAGTAREPPTEAELSLEGGAGKRSPRRYRRTDMRAEE